MLHGVIARRLHIGLVMSHMTKKIIHADNCLRSCWSALSIAKNGQPDWAAFSVKFMQKEGETAVNTYVWSQVLYGVQCMSHAQVFHGSSIWKMGKQRKYMKTALLLVCVTPLEAS